jgi:hypothetical protein
MKLYIMVTKFKKYERKPHSLHMYLYCKKRTDKKNEGTTYLVDGSTYTASLDDYLTFKLPDKIARYFMFSFKNGSNYICANVKHLKRKECTDPEKLFPILNDPSQFTFTLVLPEDAKGRRIVNTREYNSMKDIEDHCDELLSTYLTANTLHKIASLLKSEYFTGTGEGDLVATIKTNMSVHADLIEVFKKKIGYNIGEKYRRKAIVTKDIVYNFPESTEEKKAAPLIFKKGMTVWEDRDEFPVNQLYPINPESLGYWEVIDFFNDTHGYMQDRVTLKTKDAFPFWKNNIKYIEE